MKEKEKLEIKPFKMKVTPEQSRIVQKTLFKNGYCWSSGYTKLLCPANIKYLYFRNGQGLSYGTIEHSFTADYLPEIQFNIFTLLYYRENDENKGTDTV